MNGPQVDDVLRELATELAIEPSPAMTAKIRLRLSNDAMMPGARLFTPLGVIAVLGVIVMFLAGRSAHDPVSVDVADGTFVSAATAAARPVIRTETSTATPKRRRASIRRSSDALAETPASEPEVVTSQPAVLRALWDRTSRVASRRLDESPVFEKQGPEPPMFFVPPLTVEPIQIGPIRATADEGRSRQ
jgi:hypothetical protein